MYRNSEGKPFPTITPRAIRGFVGEMRWLSNFWEERGYPIRMHGLEYPSVENAYQAAKSESSDVHLLFTQIKPWHAQRQGQEIDVQEGWQELKSSVMMFCLMQKFRECPRLWKQLKKTESKVLEETNDWNDTWWGVDNKTRRGRNELGRMIMHIRSLPDPGV